MERVTIEILEQYRGITAEIKALEMEIEALYDVRKSPNGHEASGSTGPGDPTGKAAMRIIELTDHKLELLTRWSEMLLTIEKWLETVNDAEIRSIIRWRYMLGCGWKTTAKRVYGDSDHSDACRKRIKRFFHGENKTATI